jgi:transposase
MWRPPPRPPSSIDQSVGEVVVAIVGGIDIHRAQLTFDYVDLDSGEVFRGRIAPADRAQLRQWLDRFLGRTDVAFALEGCTGWRYVVEELHRAGITAHVAEPAETAARRGPKRRAKTDRSDAQLLRDLLLEGRIPESWIPPQPVLEARALVRLYKDLLDERTGWLQRVHASTFQMGVPDLDVSTMSAAGRDRITAAELSAATRTAVDVAMRQVDRLTAEMTMVREQIHAIGRRQPACRALQAAHYGIGPLTSVVIWAEMGDTRRFRSCDDAVRHAGLDVTVYSSDGRRSAGHLARQGPPMLRWALYEAAVYAGRPSSPDHAYFQQVKARLDGQLALLSMARKLARRCHHTLRNLDDQVLAPAA